MKRNIIHFMALAAILFFSANSVFAAISYEFTKTTGTYTELTAPVTNVFSANTQFSSAGPYSIGFDFNGYTQFSVSSNGFICFGSTSLGSGNDLEESSANQRPIFAPLWDILKVGPSGSVDYKVSGVSPNRVLTVQFTEMLWDKNAATPGISFQVKLYESTNKIDFIYQRESGSVSTFYGGATIGITTENTGSGEFISVNSAGTSSTTVSTNDISTKPATGTVYRFTRPTKPEVASFSPEDNGKVFDTTEDLVIVFDREVQLNGSYTTGDITIYNQSDDSDFEQVTSANISISDPGPSSGATVTISHSTNFVQGNSYYVQIGEYAFTDGGEYYAGIADATTWNFSVPTPATIDFTEDFEASLNNYWTPGGTNHARNQRTTDNTPYAGSYHYTMDSDDNFTPATNKLTLNIDLSTAGIWPDLTFWYKDFGENTNNDDGIFISEDNSNWVNAFALEPGSYPDDTWQEFRIDLKEAAENNGLSLTDSFFVQLRHIDNDVIPTRGVAFDDIAILDAPHVTSLYPVDGGQVPTGDGLVLNFDRNVTLSGSYTTGDITIYNSDDTVFEQVTSANIGGSGTSAITISHSAFTDTNSYYVVVNNDVFTDGTNNFGGITSGGTTTPTYANEFGAWSFTATANNPVVISLSPEDDTIPANPDTNLVITFDKAISKGTGNIVIYRTADDSTFQTIDVTTADVTVATNTATITHNDFECGTDYYVQIGATCFNDGSGNDYAGIADKTSWNLLAYGGCPAVDSFDPPDEGSPSGLDGVLTIYFDQDVTAGTGNVTIYDSAPAVFESIPAGDARVTITNSQVEIDPATTFSAGETYSVQIGPDAFQSSSSNWYYAGISDDTTWNFSYSLPAVTSLTPEDDGTVAGATADLKIAFDRSMVFDSGGYTSGDVTIYNSDSSVFEQIDASEITISPSSTANISHTNSFVAGNSYYVVVGGGVFYDANSTSAYFPGLVAPVDTDDWQFSMSSAPTVTNYSPIPGGEPSTPGMTLTLTFDRDIVFNSGTYSAGDITIHDDTDATTDSITAANIGVSGDQATIGHADFVSDHSYHVEIAGTVFEDTGGTAYAGIADTTWNFQRTDYPTPTFDPADGQAPLSTTSPLKLIFDRTVNVGTGNITIVQTGVGNFQVIDVTTANVTGDGTDTITIDHNALATDTDYHVLIDSTAFTDGTWNYPGIDDATTWNLGQISSTQFSATDYSPADGSTITDPTTDLVITFNLNAASVSGKYITIYDSGGGLFQQIDASSATIATNQATIAHNTLTRGQSYYVKIDSGAFTENGNATNEYAGISDSTTWDFSVKSLPQVTSFDPPDNGEPSSSTQNLVITFDRSVTLDAGYTSGDITLYNDTDTTSEAIASGSISGSGSTTITIAHPSTTFASGKAYHVEIANNILYDADGLYYAGITNATAWNFSVTGNPPSVQALTPPDGGTPSTSTLQIKFDKAVNEVAGMYVRIYRYSDDALIDDYTLPDGNVTGSGTDTITIAHSTLDYSTRYYVLIQSGAFQDGFSASWGGIANKGDWDFTTESQDPLSVTLSAFSAISLKEKVRLFWTTKSENDIVAFNIWKSADPGAEFTKINSAPIATKGGQDSGASYTFDDIFAASGTVYYYQLEGIDAEGETVFMSEAIESRTISLADALAALAIITGDKPSETDCFAAEFNGDGLVDFIDVFEILKTISK